MKKQKVAVFIGRFQPFHLGHEAIIRDAIESKKYSHLIILVGSAYQARTPKNPFTYEERKNMISLSIDEIIKENGSDMKVDFHPIPDYVYKNHKWISDVQNAIDTSLSSTIGEKEITLIGHYKDESSAYLSFFPHYKQEMSDKKVNNDNLVYHSTLIRNKVFDLLKDKKFKDYNDSYSIIEKIFSTDLNDNVIKFLTSFVIVNSDIFQNLIKEHEYLKSYKKMMNEKLPFKNIAFFTADSLVTCAGHILLIKRKIEPGKGLYALPGGFFDGNKDVDFISASIRELKEETQIKLPKIDGVSKNIRAYLYHTDIFSDMNRSERWRVVTSTSYFKLPYTTLPKIKGADDAAEAVWMPFSDIIKNRDKFFEDHLSIIDSFLNIL